MISAMIISDKATVIAVYMLAALLHECGHFIVARVLKIHISQVRLELSGVRIVTDTSLTSYNDEILLASAGPAANLISIIVCICISFIDRVPLVELLYEAERFMESGVASREGIIGFLMLSSTMHAAVNLLPVKSFDGGRIICCILCRRFGVDVADRALEITTLICALFLWTVALYLMLMISSGLGVFVFASCIFAICLQKE